MMPRLKTPALKLPSALVSWPKNASKQVNSLLGSSTSSKAEGSGAQSGSPSQVQGAQPGISPLSINLTDCAALLQDPAARLAALCGSDTPTVPLLRLLRPTAELIVEALAALASSLGSSSGKALSASAALEAVAPLSAAVDFLSIFEAPERHLELALTLHTNKHVRRRVFGHLEEALTAVVGGHSSTPLGAALEQWRVDSDALAELCSMVWEHHLYFTFLDVKGDKALLRVTAEELCKQLGCGGAWPLACCLAHTGPWVADALRSFSQKGHTELLARRHESALGRWRVQLSESLRRLPEPRVKWMTEATHGKNFWDAYFNNLYHISWTDFAEAFEEFYVLGCCPIDILVQLRRRMIGATEQRVRKCAWTKVPEEVGPEMGGEAIIDALMQEVLQNLGPHIYRLEPLKYASQASTAAAGGSSEGAGSSSSTGPVSGRPDVVGDTSKESSAKGDSHIGPPKPAARPEPMSNVAHSADANSTPNPTRVSAPAQTISRLLAEENPSRATPVDPRVSLGPSSAGPRMSWDHYVSCLAEQRKTWYIAPKEVASMDELHAEALSQVSSAMAYTQKACVLRVVSGDLAKHRPLLGPARPGVEAKEDLSNEEPLPAVVITTAGTKNSGVTKFGRGSSRKSLLPDLQMDEPIASRSHFNIVFDQENDRFCLMDAGSKWGTFLKVSQRTHLNCGDWIRVGNAEFVIRYCGGGCKCRKNHTHYKLHSFQVQKQQGMSRSMGGSTFFSLSPSRGGDADSPLEDAEDEELPAKRSEDDDIVSSDDRMRSLLTGFKQSPWLTESNLISQTSGMCQAGLSPGSPSGKRLKQDEHESACPDGSPTSLPVPPLELEFISGPRTGERLTLCERKSTLGRGEAATIQITDPMLANVSRIHCLFEYVGDRWHIRDNSSTNGTWRRLSCVLEPSKPVPLTPGMSVLAGVHEFRVEEGDLGTWWPESVAASLLDEMSARERKR
mmetsp:Transcript_55835/g.181294  ORF Transcript_55835/g.181294 Transcript_55835/m.181294 type:complete len:960 (+) Transcript_55835:156-3035(+)